MEILIQIPGQPETIGSLVDGSYRIGSSPAAHIQIDRPGVSGRHAILTVAGETAQLLDAGSRNGTFLEGKQLDTNPQTITPGEKIRVGDVVLRIRIKSSAPPPVETGVPAEANSLPPALPTRHDDVPIWNVSGIPAEHREAAQRIKKDVHDCLISRLNLRNVIMTDADAAEVRQRASTTISTLLAECTDIPTAIPLDVLKREIFNEAVGLGPVEDLLANPDVTEIMVNGADKIFVERAGILSKTDLAFAEDQQVLKVMERIVAPIGRRVDESQPLVDARLPDGSRVNCIIPPLAIDGPTLTIRKFSKTPITANDLAGYGSVTDPMLRFLEVAVRLRKNILIAGGTGSGKTTLLNVVSHYIPNGERIVTIEDAAELRLAQDHVVRLEARPPSIEGRGEIAIRDLLKNSLRMRPDRIVVGECRGGEALDMLQAMNTGHDGSLTTVHANSPRDAISRLETLVLMAGFDLPLRAIREQIASAISLIVHSSRLSDGTRKVMNITEVTGMQGEVISTQDLFTYTVQGQDPDGRIQGTHAACGMVPTFAQAIGLAGISFDLSMFEGSV